MVAAIRASRLRFLRELGARIETGLRRITAGLFDAPPSAALDRRGCVRLEGTRGGEPIAIDAVFTAAASARYVRTGYATGASAEVSVVVGLQGATPSFAFRATSRIRDVADELDAEGGRAPTERAFARAWTGAADPDLVDDEVRAELMRFVGQVRSVRSVTVGREGLRVTWHDDAGTTADPSVQRDADATAYWERSQAERIAAAAAFAARLRKRILGAVERRAQPRVRVDAYRGAPAEPEDDAIGGSTADDDAKARAAETR